MAPTTNKSKPSKASKSNKAATQKTTTQKVAKSGKSATTTQKAKTTTKAAKASTTPAVATTPATTTKRQRRVVDKESILSDFDTILTEIDGLTTTLRESDKKGPIGLKNLKSLSRQIRQLRTDASKNIKVRKQFNKENSKTSGFMKPVSVSKEICSFAGWKENELHSRVDVTKFICDYIRTNNLQNPSDRRQIKPDKKLRSLLKLKESEKEPLTYYSLQRHIQPHFTRN
tara:strand:+ start:631 stop:1317 length:687 start_codon:yes stop_codon:yes gene_type:complete